MSETQGLAEVLTAALRVWRRGGVGSVDVDADEVPEFADELARVAEAWMDDWLALRLDSDEVRDKARACDDPAFRYATADDVLAAVRDAVLR